ncbi:hypothetical protein Tco_0760468 [Tanacetum coccineum]
MTFTKETIMPQKEETVQVVIDLVKNSSCFKDFTISADVPEIFTQQFWIILDIYPRVEGVNFTDVPNDDTTLAFLIKLGYKGPLYKYNNMFVDHMHQPWRTLTTIINKCLSGKITSNDKLRKSRIDILWGLLYKENVDYPELIWEDLAYQIDHRKEKRSRREDYQEYGLSIHETMLTEVIKQSESYQMFIKYSTSQIPLKKSIGKGLQKKKIADDSQETVDVSDESEPESVKRKTSSKRRVKKKVTLLSAKLKLKKQKQLDKSVLLMQGFVNLSVLKHTKEENQAKILELSEGTGTIPRVPDESTFVSATSSEGLGTKPGVPDLRVAKLEKDVSELKKIDLSAKALAALKTQVPSVQIPELPKKQTPTVDLEQESEKTPSEILKIKKEQAEKQKMPKFTIKSTDKATLKEKSLYHRLYHALKEALIEDENAMDKGVADTVQDHKRKHDDDEDPPLTKTKVKRQRRLDWNNPKGDCYPFDLSKPLPLQRHPSHLTVAADYLFNNDLEYLKSSDPERTYNYFVHEDPKLTTIISRGRRVLCQETSGYWSSGRRFVVKKRPTVQFYKLKEGGDELVHISRSGRRKCVKDELLALMMRCYGGGARVYGALGRLTKEEHTGAYGPIALWGAGVDGGVGGIRSHDPAEPEDIPRTFPLVRIEVVEHQSDTKVLTMTMEILPEPTSNKLCGNG